MNIIIGFGLFICILIVNVFVIALGFAGQPVTAVELRLLHRTKTGRMEDEREQQATCCFGWIN